jgi:hypothetical protein
MPFEVYFAIFPSWGCSKPQASIRKSFSNNCIIDKEGEKMSDDEGELLKSGLPTFNYLELPSNSIQPMFNLPFNNESELQQKEA